MGSLGAPELLIIGVVLVLLFGATRLPQTAKGLGQSLKIFRKELQDDSSEQQPAPGALPQGYSGQAQQPAPPAQAPDATPSEPHQSHQSH
ncbi:twin-arginine translocase TatA/TatE family subunit [Actinopolymorpha sp. NPDC004070]|uniref:twin-arginine translocase TatA/TatE family subunit n=1 Tax=Actinopolymorpha sp. NPDC004070 TaxID=3154548 RepID=UPI0033ABAA7E